ncbi:MAG TPA: tRNA (adenosine(37)-N6)-dimethylallyltransferase MiaA [Chloroflexia bacterium]|nr:tRNA (adenosine(37)-N6)-dimethylallyltransferase MiaA [Chloroflexia bacterium]
MDAHRHPPLIALVGQTATGKSALAIKLCQAIGGEIVTADSRQVYRYMDIGTDKPPIEERGGVPHHMIDLVDPDEPYTLALYQSGAYQVIEDIISRGKLPVLAGGTPLYLNAVLEGWTIPRVEPDLALREELEREAEAVGSLVLHERLRSLDPNAAAKILPSNTRRIVRALEVIAITGQPISAQQSKEPPSYRTLIIGLSAPREQIYSRIDARVRREVDDGLVEEVAALHECGYSFDLRSMSGLGYRQIAKYLQGQATLPEAIQRIKWDTHAFARHQGNWFRRLQTAHWLDVSNADPYPEAVALVRHFLDGLVDNKS